jgi:hypothetical protein
MYKILALKPEEKRPLERPRRRWEDIKMDVNKGGTTFSSENLKDRHYFEELVVGGE